MPDVLMIREFCYRWKCPRCQKTNRQAEISAGKSNACFNCGELVRAFQIEYENGARSSLRRDGE